MAGVLHHRQSEAGGERYMYFFERGNYRQMANIESLIIQLQRQIFPVDLLMFFC